MNTWNFDNSYTSLPLKFFYRQEPMAVKKPKLVLFNSSLARELGLDLSDLSEDKQASIFAGNSLPTGADPIAQAYAGHQFGHFTMLGDGRALLLGEHITPNGHRFDIQLKGSGPTPFSRRGDGRATLSAMLREYLISEAMHHLGIPSSRSLAVAATGETVYRDPIQPGAVLTRVMSSHIRVGTFEFAAQYLGPDAVKELLQYTLKRHYPELLAEEIPALAFLKKVMEKQIALITHWMRVGFIHGVMNTDNMSIAWETFDYGPCAFMNRYDLNTVFSSIDQQGRYAFGNQPRIAQWNLACLAGTLLPLMHEKESIAIEMAQEVLDDFPSQYNAAWLNMMGRKLGIEQAGKEDQPLIDELLQIMQDGQLDYTNTFFQLSYDQEDREEKLSDAAMRAWKNKWKNRLQQETSSTLEQKSLMRSANPCFIPRNHRVEAALAAGAQGDLTLFQQLLQVLQNPYQWDPSLVSFQEAPVEESQYQTFCGT